MDNGFVSSIAEGAIAKHSFNDLVSKESVKSSRITGCDFKGMWERGEFIVQRSKKGKHVSVKPIASQLQGINSLSSTEEFGQFEYKWNHQGVTCNLFVHEGGDILELWCCK